RRSRTRSPASTRAPCACSPPTPARAGCSCTACYLPGDVCLTAQQGIPFAVEHHRTVVDVVQLPHEGLLELAGGDRDGEVRFTGAAPMSSAAAGRWRAAVALLRSQGRAAVPEAPRSWTPPRPACSRPPRWPPSRAPTGPRT